LQFRQYIRVATAREGVDFVDDPFKQIPGNGLGSILQRCCDRGNPVGKSSTVNADGSVSDNGGSNPASGYGLFESPDLADALAKAKGCPILLAGGTIEVAEAIDM